MAQLELQLLGSTEVRLDEQEVPGFRTSKVLALLVYLAIEPEAHSRESLMELLWPGMPEHSARHNLRQILYHLRNAIPELSAGNKTVDAVLANRQSIQLNPAAEVAVDTRQLEQLLDFTQAHDHVELLLCQRCRESLEQAVDLYGGDFLSDFYLDDSNEYENWAQARRQAYRRQALDALEILTAMQIRREEYPEAREYAERQLSIDNLREGAYRQLMEVLALSGRREEALATYERARKVLAQDLGMAPSKRTTELYEQIMAGDLSFETTAVRGVRGYELKDEIGEGAYGTIHRAIQPGVGREVAVKVIRRKLANDAEFIRRFEAEAQTVALLEHPYIVPLYDYWRDPDGAYLVMRYMRGGSLLSSLASGPWKTTPAAGMLDQVAAALDAAHGRGIVHRDIKPANILLDEAGNAFLSDFGIAKDLGQQGGLTVEGAVIGTPDYISPEQILAEEVTPQTDIYSLGAVLYETLTGEKPFPDSSVANLIYKHLNEPIPLVSNSRPDLPATIDGVIQRATAKRPADRYANALEMAEAYRQALQGEEVALVPARPSIRPEVAEIYNPFKGLRAFQEADADDFFGREALVQQMVRRLDPDKTESERFLAVVGPSGSGKSSAIKAGLVPALRGGAIEGSDKWFVAEMVPGTHPLEELELALWPVAVDPPPSLVEPMQRDSRGLLRTIRRILPDEPDAQLLLIIDQFEELFTLVEDEERRDFFIDSLLQAIAAPRSPLRVIITLRADFYDRPLQYETLGRLIKDNCEIVLP
ncbi:MAG: protein kinase, partial [Chloroflexota bacterium]